MKTLSQVYQNLLVWVLVLSCATLVAQVGIGTSNPNASAVLDVESTTQGFLTPRMTTTERLAIGSPANGLMVYDTTLKSFYHYDSSSTSWSKIRSDGSERLKYKLIKSTDVLATVLAAELANGSGNNYKLFSDTYYEINGTVVFDKPIELNGGYLSGLDSSEDKIISNVTSGALITGNVGGTIRLITFSSATAPTASKTLFNLDASANGSQNLIFRDCIVTYFANVGTIKGFSFVFESIIQFAGNTTGIEYIGTSATQKLLLSNVGWFANNTGTYEKVTGTFGLVQKQGGFSEVSGTAIGFDVASNPIVTEGILETVVFTGALTTGQYVKGYSPAVYSGYNFDNNWTVRCSGIPVEGDAVSFGEMSADYAVGAGAQTAFSNGSLGPKKVVAATASTNLFRFSRDGVDNRLKYLGKKKRFFNISGSISFQVDNVSTFIIFIAKNGTVISQYKIYGRGLTTNDIVILPLTATTELNTNDYIEVFAQRFSATLNGDSIIVPNMTITIK